MRFCVKLGQSGPTLLACTSGYSRTYGSGHISMVNLVELATRPLVPRPARRYLAEYGGFYLDTDVQMKVAASALAQYLVCLQTKIFL